MQPNQQKNSAFTDTAKAELRKVAMLLHGEARAILQNDFRCRDDIADAVVHLATAREAIGSVFKSVMELNAPQPSI